MKTNNISQIKIFGAVRKSFLNGVKINLEKMKRLYFSGGSGGVVTVFVLMILAACPVTVFADNYFGNNFGAVLVARTDSAYYLNGADDRLAMTFTCRNGASTLNEVRFYWYFSTTVSAYVSIRETDVSGNPTSVELSSSTIQSLSSSGWKSVALITPVTLAAGQV